MRFRISPKDPYMLARLKIYKIAYLNTSKKQALNQPVSGITIQDIFNSSQEVGRLIRLNKI